MDSSAKRKNPTTNGSDDRHVKRSKVGLRSPIPFLYTNLLQGGSAGRWQTPYQKARFEAQKGKGVEVGAMGFWTTCVRGKERKALEELVDICEEVMFPLCFRWNGLDMLRSRIVHRENVRHQAQT